MLLGICIGVVATVAAGYFGIKWLAKRASKDAG